MVTWIRDRLVLLLALIVTVIAVATCVSTARGQDLGGVDRALTADERCELGSLVYLVNAGRYEAASDYNGDTAVTAADFSAWVAQLDDDDDPAPPPPVDGQHEWWPGPDALSIGARDAAEVAAAFDRLDGVGGFLTLETQAAVDEFARRMSQGGGLRGRPETRVVIRTSPGVVFDRPMRNVRGEWSDLAFDAVPFTPAEHQNVTAIRIAGDCDRIAFLGCDFAGWRQVIEGQDAGTDADDNFLEPDGIEFVGGSWTRIYNASHPVVTRANENDEDDRSQGAWWQGTGWVFRDLTMIGVGWDISGDPDRRRTDKFSQVLYGSQNARDTLVENCTFDGTSNNAILMKGTGLTVRHSTFDRVVNAIAFGTNQSPRYSCTAVVEDVEIRRLIPLGWKESPSLPNSERVRADSGVAFSFVNFDGVTIRRVRFAGPNTGTRAAFLFFNNGRSSGVSASDLIVEDCDTGTLPLAEVRSFQIPPSGFTVRVRRTESPEKRVLVRSAVLGDSGNTASASHVLSSFVVDGQLAGAR